jgi:hypothetical protein
LKISGYYPGKSDLIRPKKLLREMGESMIFLTDGGLWFMGDFRRIEGGANRGWAQFVPVSACVLGAARKK